jgi:hypothetical protein
MRENEKRSKTMKVRKSKISKRHRNYISQTIRDVGHFTRMLINKLPEGDVRVTAWATCAGGIVGAALHDTDCDWRVVDMIESIMQQKALFRNPQP